jgi:CheY-like chemotaxis protein
MNKIAFDILHVDDDEIDQMAVRRALRERGIDCNLINARDGLEALDILNESYDKPSANPFIILLDINMPRMDGIEFLDRIHNHSESLIVKNAIVIVLTTSDAETDLKRAYAHNISGYMLKTDYEGGLSQLMTFLESYDRVTVFP